MSKVHNTKLVLKTLMHAIERTETVPNYLHSDQWSEYSLKVYEGFVLNNRIILSMSNKSSPWESAYQKSFYSQFKVDLGMISRFETLEELIEEIYRTIYYYNNKRFHSSLKMHNFILYLTTVTRLNIYKKIIMIYSIDVKRNKKAYTVILAIFIIILAIVGGSYIRNSFAQSTPNSAPIQQYEIQSQGMYNGTQRTVILYQQALPSILSMFQYTFYNGAQSTYNGVSNPLTYNSSNSTLCSFFYLNKAQFWSQSNLNSCD